MKNTDASSPAGLSSATALSNQRPEFFPVPPRGPDPWFGLARSSWYDLERRGLLRFVRVRKPGHIRGRVLIPFDEARDAIRQLNSDSYSHGGKETPPQPGSARVG
jgi:hypothetical protein